MKICITGAAGFIGSHLAHKLANSGHEIIAVDNFADFYDRSLKDMRVNNLLDTSNIKLFSVDIALPDQIHQLIKLTKPQVVFNLAAQPGVRLGLKGTNNYVQNNIVGFSNILKSAVENNVPFFLYASSSSVYGNDASLPFSETENNLNPTSFYGATKLVNEILVPTLIRNSNTRARGFRFFTVYGPWGRPDMAYFKIIANIIAGSEFTLYGDGKIQRDFTYIDDAIRAIDLLTEELLLKDPGYFDIVNIGGGKPVSMSELITEIEKIANKNAKYKMSGKDLNDMQKTMANPEKLISLTGFKPSLDLEYGIFNTLKWANLGNIRKNLDFWVNSIK